MAVSTLDGRERSSAVSGAVRDDWDVLDLKLWAGVANVTRGDTMYAKSATARVDDVVKFQMTYENAASVKALRDFTPYFELPTERGREYRVVVSGTALGGQVAEASVVVTSTIRGTLVYVPGTAKWRRNTADDSKQTCETAQTVDSVFGPHSLPVDNILPGSRHRATITILARVVSDQVRIRLDGKTDLTKSWRQDVAVRPGGQVLLRFEIRNLGNRSLKSRFVYRNPGGRGAGSWLSQPDEGRRRSASLVG